jgi:glycogen operon protein
VSWVDWTWAEKNADFLRFVREMIALRKRHPALRRRGFFRGTGPAGNRKPDIIWHGLKPGQPDFSNAGQTLAFALDGSQTDREPDRDFYVACNACRQAVRFRIPRSPSGRPWRRIVDTALASPLDIVTPCEGPKVPVNSVYTVAPFACIILICEG